MSKTKEKYFNIDAILKMAKDYGVSENPLFLQTLRNYATIQKAIESIDEVVNGDELTTTKEYVKGRVNLYMHPAVKELPKQIDAANKTMDKMLDIINKLGTVKQTDEFIDFINE